MERRHHLAQPHDEDEAVVLTTGTSAVTLRVPSSDIDSCIRVSIKRAVLTLFSLFLMVTDIPRTGLAFDLTQYYPQVAPDIVTRFGPYEYHVTHFNATSAPTTANPTETKIHGSVNGKPLQSLDVWGYKYDTLSVPLRALAGLLNVSSYPPCLLYQAPCKSSTLQIETVFHMLNDLITAIQLNLFHHKHKSTIDGAEVRPYSFITTNAWIDRLHQYITRSIAKNAQLRSHRVHFATPSTKTNATSKGLDPLHLCDSFQGTSEIHRGAVPTICTHPIAWHCDHPIQPLGKRRVPIWDHIAIRFNDLQRRYPTAKLDLTLITTRGIDGINPQDPPFLPSAKFRFDMFEITTLIRGQVCSSSRDDDQDLENCHTVFLDDYRYERHTMESNANHWANYTWLLRGFSQCYMWIRISLLVWGCYTARSREQKYRNASFSTKWSATSTTLLKIPGHFVVYGSWLPILGYALAHFFDSGLVHAVVEIKGSSTGGLYTFRPLNYILETSIQMRNTWMIALLWKLLLQLYDAVVSSRHMDALHKLRSNGLLGFRSGWIGILSWLTTLGFARLLSVRDTDILTFHEIPRQAPVNTMRDRANYLFMNNLGFRFDLKCSALAVVCALVVGSLAARLVAMLTWRKTNLFLSRTFYVPYSAGPIWPTWMLEAVWSYDFPHQDKAARHVATSRSGPRWKSIFAVPAVSSFDATSRDKAVCPVCGYQVSFLHWRATQGCPKHEPIFDIHRRTKALWSMVRLTNIAAMTDPIVLFQLYILGRPLYLYRVHCTGNEPSYFMLLPTAMLEKPHDSKPVQKNTWGPSFELVETVDSRQVPWHVLVNCG